MNEQNTNSSDPRSLGSLLPEVLDVIEAGEAPEGRSTDASIRYEEDNNDVLRDAAQQPGVTDEEKADLAEIVYEGTLVIEALKRGEGHSPTKPA
jgi:hypothetical protein